MTRPVRTAPYTEVGSRIGWKVCLLNQQGKIAKNNPQRARGLNKPLSLNRI